MEEKIKIKDNYKEFKNRYWDRVPKVMREHIDETVSKALKCSDVKYGFVDMDEYCDGDYNQEQENKRKGMPVMVCPNCDADFYYFGEKKTEEGSYFIDEDEPFPF